MDCQNEIDHQYTNEIVCPFCGHEFGDSWEIDGDSEDLGLIDCEECYKEFYAVRNIRVDYSTEKARYGTCKHCNKDNVVIENYTSSSGKYKDLCVNCGQLERERLIKVYFEEMDKSR